MIHDTIQKIESRLNKADTIQPGKKAELRELLDTLKIEVDQLAQTHGDQAQSIAGFTEVSTHEATRSDKNRELLQISLQGLSASVGGFEASHPRLVQAVNSFCNTLANLGI